ncbi:protein CIP2A homolog [Cimex lectularius]|uniref:CIP2A N-terminal domain-containing protein n=1 Tax=Cimex lectularius TaxID=79782 RepID=A0A8I6SB57_CIMLE|nr:protein CIP2A homolog [Cimex lectularius]
MVNRDILRSFNANCKDYFLHRTAESCSNVQRCLQILGATSDPNLYDPGSRDVVEFFINLYELLISVDVHSHLNWLAINVLLEACRNVKTRESLVHTYKFTSILTTVLLETQALEKRLKILQLLKELTYGIKITWQEAYLPSLITALTNWIMGDDVEFLPLSLSILVNLCYQNMPSIYTLLRAVNIKKFLKSILKIQKQYDPSRIEVSKLLIILEGISGGLPDQEVHAFIRVTFPNLVEALNTGNYFMMRHHVTFFKETMKNPRTSKILEQYPNFRGNMEYLISKIKEDSKIHQNCLAILFEFLTCITQLDNLDLEVFFPQLMRFALRWVRTTNVSTEALSLLCTITNRLFKKKEIDRDSEQRQEVIQRVFEVLEDQLAVIMLLMDEPESELGSCEMYSRHTALMSLLGEMINIPKFTDKIMTSLSLDLLRQLFLPLKKPNLKDSGFFQEPVYTFYVQALLFISVLAGKESSWSSLYSELLQERSIQLILSIALFIGQEDLKKKALSLLKTTGFSSECMDILASNMMKVNKLIIFSPEKDFNGENSGNVYESEPNNCSIRQIDLVPLLSSTQESYLNTLLEKYEAVNVNSENVMVSSIMELYQYKMSAMEQTLRHMQSSQEAADRRATSLQHNLSRTTTEISWLHSLLHNTQQKLEVSIAESKKLNSQISEIQSQANETHVKYTQLVQTLRSKTLIINELEEKCKELNNCIKNKNNEIDMVKKEVEVEGQKIVQLTQTIQDRNNTIEELEKEKARLQGTINDLTKELESAEQKLNELETDLSVQRGVTADLEAVIEQKNDEIAEVKKELEEQKRVREIISELVMEKGKFSK